MVRCPRFAAAGSPGTSSVRTKATKVMPRPNRTSAARRRPRNLAKGRDGSRSRPPGLRSWLAARAADVKGPGRVVVGARHTFGRDYHLPRLNQGEEWTVRVELGLDLLKQLLASGIVGGRAGRYAERLEARVGACGPARAQAHQLTG